MNAHDEGREDKQALQLMHAKLYDQIILIPNGLDFLLAVNEGIKEIKSLREQLKLEQSINVMANNQLTSSLKEIEDLNEQLAKERENHQNTQDRNNIWNNLYKETKVELQKERELRKELVEGLKYVPWWIKVNNEGNNVNFILIK